jgi:signal transduction histidine kinase
MLTLLAACLFNEVAVMTSSPQEMQLSRTLPRTRSIRVPFITAFVLAVLIPALIISILTAVVGIQNDLDQIGEQLRSIATLKEAQIDLWLDSLLTEAARITQETDVLLLSRQALPNSPFPTRREQAAADLQALFETRAEESQQFDTLFLVDLTGTVILGTGEVAVGTSLADLPVFSETPGVPYIRPAVYDPNRGHTDVHTFYPIFDRGELLAVLGATTPLTQIDPILTERAGMGESGETYLVDTNQALLTTSRFENYGIGTTRVNTEGVIATLVGQSSGTGRYADYRGVPIVGYYEWLPRLGVVLLAEKDQAEVLAPTYLTIAGNTVITLVAVVVVVLVGLYFVERRITRPIAHLSETAQQIADGNYQLRVDIDRDDEIGVLARTFNTMTENIQARTQDLIRANALAQESARLKSQFLSTMSHELRTPLNAVIGFTTIMLQGMSGQIDDRAKHMLQRIAANGQRLLQLIDDVLNIAKIESGRMELANEPFDPRALAYKLQSQLGMLADQKGLTFNVEVSDNVPRLLYGDEARVNQIVTNLLGNAFKFTEQGEVKLSMDWENDAWVVRVSDTGIGIPPHAHSLIFEAFRQLDGSSRRVYGGSGLGLAIVRNLTTMMEGNITVDSALGRGSTFTVTLPLPVSNPTEAGSVLATA